MFSGPCFLEQVPSSMFFEACSLRHIPCREHIPLREHVPRACSFMHVPWNMPPNCACLSMSPCAWKKVDLVRHLDSMHLDIQLMDIRRLDIRHRDSWSEIHTYLFACLPSWGVPCLPTCLTHVPTFLLVRDLQDCLVHALRLPCRKGPRLWRLGIQGLVPWWRNKDRPPQLDFDKN